MARGGSFSKLSRQAKVRRSAGAWAALQSDEGGLPEGATAYASFKDGTYFYGGNALSDFLVEETGYGPFDTAAVIEGVGLDSSSPGPGDQSPVLAPALTAELLASGFRMVLRWQHVANCGLNVEILDLPDYNVELFARADNSGATRLLQVGGAEETLDYHVVAGSNEAEISFNGSTQIGIAVNGNPEDTLSVDPGHPHNSIVILVERGAILEDIELYPY